MPLIRKPKGPTPTPEVVEGDGLASASADARWSAARALHARTDVGDLATALQRETDPRVREAILTSLSRIGGADSARAIARGVRSEDASARTAALDALRAMDPDGRSVFPELLSDPDSDVRLLACELFRDLPGDESSRLLSALISSDSEINVVAAAVEVLTEVGTPDALPALDLCAQRFGGEPFLAFAVQVARERIGGQLG